MSALKPRFCYTASGVLIINQRVLLLKHKKLATWLTPGGHVEKDELSTLKKNNESEKLAWFTLQEIKKMSTQEIFEQVRAELVLAFKLSAN